MKIDIKFHAWVFNEVWVNGLRSLQDWRLQGNKLIFRREGGAPTLIEELGKADTNPAIQAVLRDLMKYAYEESEVLLTAQGRTAFEEIVAHRVLEVMRDDEEMMLEAIYSGRVGLEEMDDDSLLTVAKECYNLEPLPEQLEC